MKKNNKKLTLADFVWQGFNYSVGIGFISNFAILSNVSSQNSPVGIHVVWMFVLEGIIAGICALAFAKMARIHRSDNNGAGYIYVRTNMGKFWGIFVAFINYIALPFLITIQIMFIIRGSFGVDWVVKYTTDNLNVVHITGSVPWYAAQWGPFSDLWLDFIGIFIYSASSLIIFGGIKLYKRLNNWFGGLRWIISALLIIAGIVLACMHGSDNMQYWQHNSHLSLGGFIKAFNSCFFFFAGFEVFSTAGKNIVNPNRNIGRGIILIMILATVFYVVVSIIFFAAFTSFTQNMNLTTWNSFNSKALRYGGPIIMIICSKLMSVTAAMQNALFGGTALQPLAKEGFISERYKELNKDGLAVRASVLNFVITAAMIFIWLAIPDIAKGFYLLSHYGWNLSLAEMLSYHQPFDSSSLTEASSVISIFVYAMVICVVLKLGLKKKVKMNILEWIIFPFILVVLAFVFVWHYYSLVDSIVSSSGADRMSHIIGAVIEIAFIVISVLFVVIWYHTYYRRKYEFRVAHNRLLQDHLDQEFILLDEWLPVAQDMMHKVEKRLALHKDRKTMVYDPEEYEQLSEINQDLEAAIEYHEQHEVVGTR